jgi:hypothetical protein
MMNRPSAIGRAVAGAVSSIFAHSSDPVTRTRGLQPIEPLESRLFLSVANVVGTSGNDYLAIDGYPGSLTFRLNGAIVASGADQFTYTGGGGHDTIVIDASVQLNNNPEGDGSVVDITLENPWTELDLTAPLTDVHWLQEYDTEELVRIVPDGTRLLKLDAYWENHDSGLDLTDNAAIIAADGGYTNGNAFSMTQDDIATAVQNGWDSTNDGAPYITSTSITQGITGLACRLVTSSTARSIRCGTASR